MISRDVVLRDILEKFQFEILGEMNETYFRELKINDYFIDLESLPNNISEITEDVILRDILEKFKFKILGVMNETDFRELRTY